MFQNTPIWKVAATSSGALLTLNATWLNAAHIAHVEGWHSPLLFAGVIVTVTAAMTPPFAERASTTGQPLKAVLLWLFFALAVAFSLSTSIARSSGFADGKTATAEKVAERARLAKEGYEAAKQAQRAECEKRGSRCRAAETAVSEARSALQTASPVMATDPGAKRLSAVTGISEASVALYLPLMLPLALELGGFVLLALGLAPRRRETETAPPVLGTPELQAQPEAVAIATVATPAKRGSSAYYLGRLERDFPEIRKKVADGEMSVYAASVAAGLRKSPSKKWTKADAYLENLPA